MFCLATASYIPYPKPEGEEEAGGTVNVESLGDRDRRSNVENIKT